MSESSRSHGLQYSRLLCPSLSPRVCSDSCPLSWLCHLILCRPLLLLPSIFPSTRVFSKELALHNRWPEYWTSASASVSILHSISSVYVTIPIYFQYVEETDQREWRILVERSADCDGVPGGCRFLFSLIPKPWLYSDLFTATCLPIKSCFAQAGLIGFLPLLSKRVLIH